MFGYLTWERRGRPAVTLRTVEIGGAPFLHLAARGEERRLRRRVRRAVAQMERCGIRRAVLPPDWPEAWRGNLLPPEEGLLRQVLLPELLDCICRERALDLKSATTLLSAPYPEQCVWQAARLLAQRSRYLVLEVEGAEALRRALWREYGLSAGDGRHRPALQICFGEPVEQLPALLLGANCRRRQAVRYALAPPWEERLAPWETGAQLVTALWESGRLPRGDIRVQSIGTNA